MSFSFLGASAQTKIDIFSFMEEVLAQMESSGIRQTDNIEPTGPGGQGGGEGVRGRSQNGRLDGIVKHLK